ncbi:MAG: hypothetical protein WA990_16605 [Rubrobacteraceae bacterium]
MSENPEDKTRERRRTGPLGEDSGDEEKTRVSPPEDEGKTRRVSSRRSGRGEARETKAMRAPVEDGGRQRTVAGQSGGYFEAMEEREERLREIYGGIDWLASFLGFVFALVAGAFLSGIAGLVLVPLGFSLNLDFSASALGPAAITGLVVVAVVLFLTYFLGGYVSGRLARFDGGLNGVMLILWTLVFGLLIILAGGILSSFLPASFADQLRNVIQGNVLPAFDNLVAVGAIGIGILVGTFLVALLGGFLGGRTGGRYHTDIDYTL